MLACYRLQAGLSLQGAACAIEVSDGIDVDSILPAALRAWYAAQLDSADPQLLPTVDIGPSLRPTQYSAPAGSCRLVLPASARRLLSLHPSPTGAPACIYPADALDEVLRRQLNPYTAATAEAPEAVMLGSGGGSIELLLWPAAASVASAKVVTDPGDDSFVLDEQLLARLPSPSEIIANL